MKYFFILSITLSAFFLSCKTIEKDDYIDWHDKAKEFVMELIENPDDAVTILENENYIDCKRFLQEMRSSKDGELLLLRKLNRIRMEGAEIVGTYITKHETDGIIFKVAVSPPFNYFEFVFKPEQKLELIRIKNPE